MSLSMDEVASGYRKSQAMMREICDGKTVLGRRMEIPWKNRAPVKVLFYDPPESTGEALPVFLNLHGGGFVEGDAVTMDSFCTQLASDARVRVVNINYSLAPEHVFPYPIEETQAVCAYLQKNSDALHIDAQKIGIGGFSAGATIALGAIISALRQGAQPYQYCVCGYPAVSFFPEDSQNDCAGSAVDERMNLGIQIYQDGRQDEPECTPLRAEDAILAQMPRTLLFVAGKDELNRQGKQFAARLVENGVTIYFHEYKEAYHGFFEVNRDDYFMPDFRKNELQKKLTEEAQQLIVRAIQGFVED